MSVLPTLDLREHLLARRAAIDSLSKQAVRPLAIHATVTAESRSGVRRLRIGEFQSLSDSDRSYAGYNFGAGSWDLLVGALPGHPLQRPDRVAGIRV